MKAFRFLLGTFLLCLGSLGAFAQSQPVVGVAITSVTVGGTTYTPPNESSGPYTSPVTITASATGAGPFTYSFYVNGSTIAGNGGGPVISWTPPQPGTYFFSTSAVDAAGNTATSLSIRYFATGTIINSPSNTTLVPQGSTVVLKADATTGGGFIKQIQFFDNGVPIDGAIDATAPYSYIYTVPGAVGSVHAITAQARDNNDAAVPLSAAVTLNVINPITPLPAVTISSPINNAVMAIANSAIPVSVDASSSTGRIGKVELYIDGALFDTKTTFPYAFSWTPTVVGTYVMVALAYDDKNNVIASNSVSVRIAAPPTVTVTQPTSGATVTGGTPTQLKATATDSGGNRIVSVQFFVDGAFVGDSSTPVTGTTSTYQVPATLSQRKDADGNILPSVVTAVATNAVGLTGTSAPISVTVTSGGGGGTTVTIGNAPTVGVTSPTAGTQIVVNSANTLAATANDSDGNISSVQFFVNNVSVGTTSVYPYRTTWTPTSLGTYTVTAKATDNDGNITTSTAVTVGVVDPTPNAPTVAVTSPATGSNLPVNVAQTLRATATDSGSITNVQFFINGQPEGAPVLAFPYATNWTPKSPGSYTITARATNASGNQATSPAVNVVVAAASGGQPTVALTSTPNGSSVTVNTPVIVSARAVDADGTVAVVEFFANGQLIGSRAAAPYLISWVPVAAGTYAITAAATDDAGNRVVSTSSSVTATVPVGLTPASGLTFNDPSVDTPTGTTTATVDFTKPVKVSFGSKLLIKGSALDTDGSISSVQFFANGTSIGTVSAAPYYVVWQLNTLNDVVLTALVTDSSNNVVYTNPIIIETVATNSMANAAVTLTSPADGATYTAGGQIVFSAGHNFGTSPAPKIDFYVNGSQFATVSTAPYQTLLGITRAGVYDVHAVARSGTDTTVSSPVRITVTSNSAPAVAIVSPTRGSTFVVGAGFTIAATATDQDGTIQNVQFFVNGAALSTDTTAPYTATFNPATSGSYTLTALATDDAGNQTASPPVQVTLTGNSAPTVVISNPATSVTANAGTAVSLVASASDSDGTITGVRFLANGTVVGSAATAPFTISWTPTAPGSYSVVAEATDNSGNVTSSRPVTVTVATNTGPTVAVTGPGVGSAVRIGSATSLSANASDSDGTITSVQFFANGAPIGNADTTPPYAAVWSPTAEGVYRLTAVATDNSGTSTTSATVTVLAVAAGAVDAVYSGTYAGLGENGRFALVSVGNRAAAFIAFSTTGTPRTYFYPSLPVAVGGGFSSVDATGRTVISGSTSETGVAGTFDGGRLTFIGPVSFGGSSAVPAGYYTGNLSGRMDSTVAAIVGQDGSITVFVTDGASFRDAGAGSINSSGAFAVTTPAGNRINGTIDPATGFLTGSITAVPGGSFLAALSSGVSFSDGFLRNLSTRGEVGTGANVLIAGFVVGGNVPKQVLVRAIGPSLAPFGVNGALANPQLQVFNGNTLVAANDNWGGDPVILNASNQAGAFALTPSSLDAALLLTLAPGSYTAQVSGAAGGVGVALVELYDIDNLAPFSTQKVMNVATRGVVGSGQSQLIAGFVVSGNTPKKILVRGVGPSLGNPPFNVPGVLADPSLRIVRSDGLVVRENDNWEVGNDSMVITNASARVGAFALAGGSRDSAVLITLPPGAYTAQVFGSGTGTGVALVEVYEVP